MVKSEWKKDITTIARRNKTLKKNLKPMLLPLAEDVVRMRNFLRENEDKALEMIKKQ